ncbi:TadA family conjugal transfer-associated ATPase [Angustibacter luteus]|uniref:TadA family conjugal transfer-associated ATPase n=1 Tax=Angustibacter luteus TaxID=658456 RepID=A0ABW1JCS1_9ACTN
MTGASAQVLDAALLARIRDALAGAGQVTPDAVAQAAREVGVVLGHEGLLQAVDRLRADLHGAGPLQPLLADPDVTDVLVNGPGSVWVDRGRGVQRVRVDVGDERDVRALAARLAGAAGRRLDDASPFVDAQLADGVRLHVALPPLVAGGTHVSLRVPSRRELDLADLVRLGTVPPPWAQVLEHLMSGLAAFVVSGGTGAGKTTVLGALLGLVPPAHRIVVVEDCAEVRVQHPHVVRLAARSPNVEGRGAVTLTDLVRQALRMRPDRLVVGEVRGAEVRELLAALNPGHEGGCGTLHANSVTEVPARLEALGALAGLDRATVHAQVAAAIQVVLHLRRHRGARRLVQVGVVQRIGDLVQVVPALVADPADPSAVGVRGPGWGALRERLELP